MPPTTTTCSSIQESRGCCSHGSNGTCTAQADLGGRSWHDLCDASYTVTQNSIVIGHGDFHWYFKGRPGRPSSVILYDRIRMLEAVINWTVHEVLRVKQKLAWWFQEVKRYHVCIQRISFQRMP
jgi:hypothetical protein